MFKFIIGGRRRAGMTKRDYGIYAQRTHGGKTLTQPEPSIIRYVQTHIVDSAYGTETAGWHPAPDFDSVTELWFESAAAMQRELESDHYRNVVKPDEPRFVDPSRIIVMGVSEEEPDVPTRLNGSLKVMRFLRRATGTTQEDFLEAWRSETSRLLAQPGLGEKVCRMVRNCALKDAREAVAEDFALGTPVNVYDGVENIWFDDLADMTGCAAYRAAIANSPFDAFLDRSAEMLLIGQERVIIPLT